ncbi:MAG: prenyltransferase [Candidatus Omnitrophica bacterium]|nr:prenyltransferase [Candidatus Omnitrophota bacterium]
MQIKYIARALRLAFVTASVLPYVFGSLINTKKFCFLSFIFGLFAVVCTHLSANLINDYADAKTGADSHDAVFYGFFGGSKLIQEGRFLPEVYFKFAVLFAVIALSCVFALSLLLKSVFIILIYFIIIILSWQYSAKPLQFCYYRLGEFFIFLLFGPALVMGGYFIQTGIFPDLKSFVLSVPFGLFTTAILFANEVPDFITDVKSAKFTWVGLVKQNKTYLAYMLIVFLAFSFVGLSVILGFLKPLALFSLIFIFPSLKAANILRKHYLDKIRLVESSKLTIAVQAAVSVVLILGIWL